MSAMDGERLYITRVQLQNAAMKITMKENDVEQ